MRRRRIVVLVVLAAAAVFAVERLADNLGDPARMVAILDGVHVPPSWQAVHTDANRDLLTGSSAYRSFLVDADPADAALTVKEAMQAVGFTVDPAPLDWCFWAPFDASPIPSTGLCPTKEIDCVPNGPDGPITCTVSATRGRDRLFVTLSPRGTISSYYVGSESVYFGDPNHSLIVMGAHRRAREGLFD
jgi:hypothetical protein